MYQPSRPEVAADRLTAFRQGGPETIERLLRRVPALAEALLGEGPFVDQFVRPTSKTIDSVSKLASTISTDGSMSLILGHADRIEAQLLALSVWHGGLVGRDQAISETGADPEVLDKAAAGLADLMAIDPTAGWVALREGVMGNVYLPGRLFRPFASAYTVPELSSMLVNRGVEAGARKWEVVDRVESAMRDGAANRDLLSRLDLSTVRLFERLCRYEGGPAHLDRILDDHDYYADRRALGILASLGLIGVDPSARETWVWLDVLAGLRGGLFPDWSVPMLQPLAPADEYEAVSMPGVISQLDRMLAQYTVGPVAALKGGGIGVTAIRATAKVLKTTAPTVGLLTVLSVELGLLAAVIKSEKGRGRNRIVEEEWRSTKAASEWKLEQPARRWVRLISAWLDSNQIPLDGKPVERYEFSPMDRTSRVARGLFARALIELGRGSVDPADFIAWLVHRYPLLLDLATTVQLLEEAEVLGLLAKPARLSLTPAAWLLLTGGDLDGALSGGPTTFVVQADHTVIAPPDLSADVASVLEGFAHLESSAGARIYRIDEHGVTSAIDGGRDVTEIIAFLLEHSPTGLPQNVERTILDTAARHGKLQVGSAATWIASDDPALISAALAVKAAKLTPISPSSAVSSLPRTKVMAALRAAGLGALDTGADEWTPSPWRRPATERREKFEVFPTDLAALVAGLSDESELTYEVDWDSELDRLTNLRGDET